MAIINIINDQWQGHSHGEVEDALKALLATMLQDIEAAGIPAGGVTAEMLATALRTKIANAVTAIQVNGSSRPSNNGIVTLDPYYTKTQIDGMLADVDDALGELATVATSGSYNDLSNKPTIPDVSGLATKTEVATGLATKQDTLTFDNTPTANSNNPVKSGGVYTALAGKQDTISDLATIRSKAGSAIQGIIVGGNEVTPDANRKVTIPAGADGKSAYECYVETTSDNPVLSESAWLASLQGPQGDSTITDLNDVMTRIVNNLTTGGGANILSAEMGKALKTAIETLMNSIGEYAFPNGRPTLSWQGTMHTIDQTGLSHVTSDCALASIADGSSLTIQLTVDTNYTLDTVIVTMGGVDITATAYNSGTGVITINTVTGPIVITATAVLPYDAEIEYLESSGTQWIDTGIAVTGDGFKTEIKADVQAADSSWHNIFGARDASARYGIPFGLKPTDSGGTWYSQYGLGSNNNGVVADDNSSAGSGLHTMVSELSGNNAYLTIDGTTSSAYCPSNTYSNLPSLTLYLCGTHREDSTIVSISAKVYYCKIWDGGELVFDAIPVRVGQVGYMYDKVSGELLGNIGTGSFTLGNDLTV